MIYDGTMTAGSAVLTAASGPFSSSDVGKTILVPSAGGYMNVPLLTTIASYQSATQVTLTAAASSAVSNAGAVYATDDTTAIQSAINAAVAYAQAHGEESLGEIILNGTYGVAGALSGTYQNAQLVIPHIDPTVGPKINLKFTGPQEALGPVHWTQPNPPMPLGTLVSLYYNDTSAPPTPYPVVIGGPATGAYGGNGGLFSNMRVIVDGINILVAYRPSISGLDLYGVGQADIRSFSYFAMARAGSSTGGWPPYLGMDSNPAPWDTFGYRTPTTGNNAQNDAGKITIYGPKYGVMFTDHFRADVVRCVFCYYAVATAAIGTPHGCEIGTLVSEQCYSPLVAAQYNAQPVFIASMQTENAIYLIDDPGNNVYGEVHAEQEGLNGYIPGGKYGAANVKLILSNQPLGAVTIPEAVPTSGTPFTNAYWENAEVTIMEVP